MGVGCCDDGKPDGEAYRPRPSASFAHYIFVSLRTHMDMLNQTRISASGECRPTCGSWAGLGMAQVIACDTFHSVAAWLRPEGATGLPSVPKTHPRVVVWLHSVC